MNYSKDALMHSRAIDFFQAWYNFIKPGNLYRDVMTDLDRENLVGNIVGHPGGAQKRIQLCQTALFFKAEPDYGRRVAKGFNLDIKEIEKLANMSQDERAKATS